MNEYRRIRLSRGMTVGAFLERTIYDLRNPKSLYPTSNWQCYVSLLHKLQAEGSIINTPVSHVSDKTFRQLIKWMKRRPNYNGTLKVFTALLNRARRARLTKYKADFPYRDYAPRASGIQSAAAMLAGGGSIHSLSVEQWSAFVEFELSGIAGNPYRKELYRDFCILLYELRSRPMDVLNLRYENIAFDASADRFLCSYVPAKKVNQGNVAVQYLSREATKIIDKYRRKSNHGYVFPFPMNNRKWNLSNPAQFEIHYKAARNQLACINRFLHNVGGSLGLPFTFTLYAVRRSALTHAVMEGRIPLPILAQMAGTSVRMLERHYINYLHILPVL